MSCFKYHIVNANAQTAFHCFTHHHPMGGRREQVASHGSLGELDVKTEEDSVFSITCVLKVPWKRLTRFPSHSLSVLHRGWILIFRVTLTTGSTEQIGTKWNRFFIFFC